MIDHLAVYHFTSCLIGLGNSTNLPRGTNVLLNAYNHSPKTPTRPSVSPYLFTYPEIQKFKRRNIIPKFMSKAVIHPSPRAKQGWA